MRLSVVLLLTCLVLFVFIEAKPSNSSSKSAPSKSSSVSGGKVSKSRHKSNRHHSDSSSESSEHKYKKRRNGLRGHRLDAYRIKEHVEKSNYSLPSGGVSSSNPHKIHNRLNVTRNFGNNLSNSTLYKKCSTLSKNTTSCQLLKTNITQSTDLLNQNMTTGPGVTFGFNNFTYQSSNTSNWNTSQLKNFLNYERNSDQLKNRTGEPNPYGWNLNLAAPPNGTNNHTIGNGAPSYGWAINSPLSGAYSSPKPNIPYRNMHQAYSNVVSYYPSAPNLIPIDIHPSHFADTNTNKKTISNIAPDYGWGVQNPGPFSPTAYSQWENSPRGNVYTVDDGEKSSEEKHSTSFKSGKKAMKKFFKAIGKGVSSDLVKDRVKEVASSYFSNPPPTGWFYNPPYPNSSLVHYGNDFRSLPFHDTRKQLSADDWRSIIFSNTPMKVDTGTLYSTSFPLSQHDFDLSYFSGKGPFPDLKERSIKKYYLPPYHQPLFAGLQNKEMNDNLRGKRELSAKGKVLADAINMFLMKERNCNDTDLLAKRKKRELVSTNNFIEDSDASKKGVQILENFPSINVKQFAHSAYDLSILDGSHEKSTEPILRINKKGVDDKSDLNDMIKEYYQTSIEMPSPPILDSSLSEVENTTVSGRNLAESVVSKKTSLTTGKDNLKSVSPTVPQELNSSLWGKVTSNYESIDNPYSSQKVVWNENSTSGSHYTTVTDTVTTENPRDKTDLVLPEVFNESHTVSKQTAINLDTTIQMFGHRDSLIIKNDENHAEHYRIKINTPSTELYRKTTQSSEKAGMYFFGVFIKDYKSNVNINEQKNHRTESSSSSSLLNSLNYEETSDSGSGHVLSANEYAVSKGVISPSLSKVIGISSREFSHEEIKQPTSPINNVNLNGDELSLNTGYTAQGTSEPISPNPATESRISIAPTTESLGADNKSGLGTSFTTSRPFYSLTSWPFKIHNIMSQKQVLSEGALKHSTTTKQDHDFVDDTVMIKAPLRKVVCPSYHRVLNGRCRRVW